MSKVIWLIDTSVLCNILRVPGRCQAADTIAQEFAARGKRGDTFLLPLTTVLETGNHIGQLKEAGLRRMVGERFIDTIRRSLAGELPFAPIAFPENKQMLGLLPDFSMHLEKGSGFGDYLVVQDWRAQIELNRTRAVDVAVWSTDGHLDWCYHYFQ